MPVSIRDIKLPNGTALHRSVCIQNQLAITSYCSWKPDPGARSVDALSISWAREAPYLFSPFYRIGKALLKISREAVDSACLIAPAWPSQIWYPQLLAMLTGPPILLPTEDYLLLSPDQRSYISPPAGREPVPGRLAYLRQHFEMQGLSPRAAELLIESWRGNTNDACNSAWRKWLYWCTEQDINPISTSVMNIMQFLVDQFDTSTAQSMR